MTGEQAKQWVDGAYSEIVTWSSNNLFEPPMCNGTSFMIKQMTQIINNYNQDTFLAPIALKVQAIIPHLFLNKTQPKSKHRENIQAVNRRMELWRQERVDQLLDEAKALQQRNINSGRGHNGTEDEARIFGDKMCYEAGVAQKMI